MDDQHYVVAVCSTEPLHAQAQLIFGPKRIRCNLGVTNAIECIQSYFAFHSAPPLVICLSVRQGNLRSVDCPKAAHEQLTELGEAFRLRGQRWTFDAECCELLQKIELVDNDDSGSHDLGGRVLIRHNTPAQDACIKRRRVFPDVHSRIIFNILKAGQRIRLSIAAGKKEPVEHQFPLRIRCIDEEIEDSVSLLDRSLSSEP